MSNGHTGIKPPTQPTSFPQGPPIGKMTPYQEFLYRQGQRILARGGSVADVADYVEHAEKHNVRAIVEPPVEAVEAPGFIRGLAQQVLQGATFGFGDEALGSLYGIISGEGAQAGRNLYRQELEAWRKEHSKTALAAQVAGGFIPAGLGIAAAGVRGAATVGAATGAAYGAGEAEGGISDRAKTALVGGVAGGLLGPVGAKGSEFAGRQLAKAASALPALERLPGSAAHMARSALAKAFQRDGISVVQAAQTAERRAQLGLPTTVADIGGDHVMTLAHQAQQFRTPQMQGLVDNLVERQAGQGARLLGALGQGTRLGVQNAYDLSEQLIAQRARQAEPLYRRAFTETVEVSQRIKKLLKSKVFKDAYNAGRGVAAMEDAAQLDRGLSVPPLEDVLKSGQVPIRALDYMKRGLDYVISQQGKEGKPPLPRQTAKALRTMLSDVLDEASNDIPVYKEARGVWQGFSEQIDELARGREKFFTKAPEVITRELANSPAPEAYKIGAIQAVADAVHGSAAGSGTLPTKLFGAGRFSDRTMARRMAALFEGDQSAAQEFMDKVAGETAIRRTTQELGRRGTAQPENAARALIPAGPGQRVLREIGAAKPPVKRGTEIADELTTLFTKGLDDPYELVAMLRSLESFLLTGEIGKAGAATAAGRAGAELAQERR